MGEQLACLTSENLPDTVDVPVVCAGVDCSGAAAFAVFDVVLQAQPTFSPADIFGSDRNPAGAYRVKFPDQIEYGSGHRRVGVWSVVS